MSSPDSFCTLPGPRTRLKASGVKTSERGDVEAMNQLAHLACPMFSEEYFPGWVQDDREGIRWCRLALLAGDRSSVQYLDRFYSDQTATPKASPLRREQWKILSAELEKISDDDPNSAALIAACARKLLPPGVNRRPFCRLNRTRQVLTLA
jgi:hypothetical protein